MDTHKTSRGEGKNFHFLASSSFLFKFILSWADTESSSATIFYFSLCSATRDLKEKVNSVNWKRRRDFQVKILIFWFTLIPRSLHTQHTWQIHKSNWNKFADASLLSLPQQLSYSFRKIFCQKKKAETWKKIIFLFRLITRLSNDVIIILSASKNLFFALSLSLSLLPPSSIHFRLWLRLSYWWYEKTTKKA